MKLWVDVKDVGRRLIHSQQITAFAPMPDGCLIDLIGGKCIDVHNKYIDDNPSKNDKGVVKKYQSIMSLMGYKSSGHNIPVNRPYSETNISYMGGHKKTQNESYL